MSEWYFIKNGQQQGPVGSDQLKQLAATGTLGREDLVWKNGMQDWIKAATVNGLFTVAPLAAPVMAPPMAAAPPPQYAAVPAPGAIGYYSPTGRGDVTLNSMGMDMLRQTKPWVRFISVLMFIGAGFIVVAGLIALVGLGSFGVRGSSSYFMGMATGYVLLGVLYLIPAIFLSRYASNIGRLVVAPNEQNLNSALQAQKSFWKFIGVLMLIILIIYGVIFLVAFLATVMR